MRSVAILSFVVAICSCASINALKIPSETATNASPTTSMASAASTHTSESPTTYSTEQVTSMHTSESLTTNSTEQASPTHTNDTQTTDPTEQNSLAQAVGIIQHALEESGIHADKVNNEPQIKQTRQTGENTGKQPQAIDDVQHALWDLGTALGDGVGADENEVSAELEFEAKIKGKIAVSCSYDSRIIVGNL
ncbi:hypothetical protein AAHC03_020944 [Spirometra sp. Aus1]